MGGDSQLSSNLSSDPTSWETYSKWSATVYSGAPTHISFHTTAIWILMSAFTNDTLKTYAEEVNQAFTWIVTHPRVYKTTVTFDIQSDCKFPLLHAGERWGTYFSVSTSGAEFNLLTPSAVILPDDANPYPPETLASLSRVQWGREHSHDYQRQTLRFASPLGIRVESAVDLFSGFSSSTMEAPLTFRSPMAAMVLGGAKGERKPSLKMYGYRDHPCFSLVVYLIRLTLVGVHRNRTSTTSSPIMCGTLYGFSAYPSR